MDRRLSVLLVVLLGATPSLAQNVLDVAPPSAQAPAQPEGSPTEQALEQGGRLDLMCFGGGAANKPTFGSAYGWNSYGGSGGAIFSGQRSQGFEDQVSLRMQGAEGQVRMPRTMLPPIRGGQDGWFKLSNVQIKQNEITASVSVNPFNSPKLRLDRYSGSISISGKAGDYSGQCRRFDPAAMQRQF